MNTTISFKVGQKVWFNEDPLPYTIQAANKRFVVCTRKLNKRKDANLVWQRVEMGAYCTFSESYQDLKTYAVYTIADLQQNIRGTEDLIFCMGFNTKKQCREALQRLTKGESKVSHRNRCDLNVLKVSHE